MSLTASGISQMRKDLFSLLTMKQLITLKTRIASEFDSQLCVDIESCLSKNAVENRINEICGNPSLYRVILVSRGLQREFLAFFRQAKEERSNEFLEVLSRLVL